MGNRLVLHAECQPDPCFCVLGDQPESTVPQCLHVEQIRALGEEKELPPGCSEALTMSRLPA